MAAIITDQIRILNAQNFVSGVQSTSNSYYSFVGLPNPTNYDSDWDNSPPAPKESFKDENIKIVIGPISHEDFKHLSKYKEMILISKGFNVEVFLMQIRILPNYGKRYQTQLNEQL